jgi:hypothetical protein
LSREPPLEPAACFARLCAVPENQAFAALAVGRPGEQVVMSSDGPHQLGYRTHILIGVRGSGSMSIICHWHYLPRHTEVQSKIAGTHESYDTFLLCTPTSVMPAQQNESRGARGKSTGRYQ